MRVMNFGPGPATLPLPVLEALREDLLEFGDTGISMLEHSHRGAAFEGVLERATELLRELLAVPDTHDVLFMQGGASAQFAMVPMSFLEGGVVDVVDTGTWSKKAHAAAGFYGTARYAARGLDDAGAYVRAPQTLELSDAPRYVHLTTNATITGVQYRSLPELPAGLPLVVDASSDILSEPLDLGRVAFLYAGAQKNLGPAGVTVVLAHRAFLATARKDLPDAFRYDVFQAKRSAPNTPPTYAIHVLERVLAWVKAEGGAPAMAERNTQKAAAVYGALDAHAGFYELPVEAASRSRMNVVARLAEPALEASFLTEAAAAGMVGLKGHRSVGGLRFSLYNAVEPAWAEALAGFIDDFARRHG
ncbi:MAG: 3-phosphoserine/phosphohydroxythreonine transaminase [Myxococcota bacterium]